MKDYPPALFAYAVTPDVTPCTTGSGHPSTVTLMITVNNPTGKHVNCPTLVFSLPVGSRAGDLTSNPGALAATSAQGVPWTITSDKAGNLTALPEAGTTGLRAGDSIAFLVSNIEVNALPGLAMVSAWEQSDELRYTSLGISKVPPGLDITSFTVNPVQIPAGGSTTLSWTTTGAQTCTLSWQGNSRTGLPVDGTLPVSPVETTTYTLTATSTPSFSGASHGGRRGVDSAPVSQQITVYVPQVSILSFGASPGQVPQDGPTTLSWRVQNATSCTVTPGETSVDPLSGTLVVNPNLSGTYVLSASGFGRVVSMPAPVTVKPVTVGPFTATPSQLPPGATLSSTLRWSTQWATDCSIDGIGKVPLSGSVQVTPATSTTYSLRPVGLDPPPTTVRVTICPAITSLCIQTFPGSALAVAYGTVGGAVSAALGSGPSIPYPSVGSISLGTPFSLVLAVSGLGLRSAVTIQAPGEAAGVLIKSLYLACGYSVNAPGATASLSWDIEGGQPSGTVTAQETSTFGGATGSITFDVGPGAASGGDTWRLALHLTSDTSPTGPALALSGAPPTPVSNPSYQPSPPPHPPISRGEPS